MRRRRSSPGRPTAEWLRITAAEAATGAYGRWPHADAADRGQRRGQGRQAARRAGATKWSAFSAAVASRTTPVARNLGDETDYGQIPVGCVSRIIASERLFVANVVKSAPSTLPRAQPARSV